VDVGGGGSSSFTSQAYLGVGRAFDWGDISLVAKNAYYQFKPNKTTVDLNMFRLCFGSDVQVLISISLIKTTPARGK